MLSIMRQGAIYLYKLNFVVDLIIGNEQIRDYIIRCFHFADVETDKEMKCYSRSNIICDTPQARLLVFSSVAVTHTYLSLSLLRVGKIKIHTYLFVYL